MWYRGRRRAGTGNWDGECSSGGLVPRWSGAAGVSSPLVESTGPTCAWIAQVTPARGLKSTLAAVQGKSWALTFSQRRHNLVVPHRRLCCARRQSHVRRRSVQRAVCVLGRVNRRNNAFNVDAINRHFEEANDHKRLSHVICHVAFWLVSLPPLLANQYCVVRTKHKVQLNEWHSIT